ncbi:MAG TPA: hypothetical protein VE604_01135 [Candidatus Polarisedimenticolia bacterium]|nr:hypothetical protein [Candidatus Polarisedimenticolia bacterium]
MEIFHLPRTIPRYPGSYALISSSHATDTAVIFVHGFGGKSTSTWRDFQGLVDKLGKQYSWPQTSDMFFYSYDSRRAIQVNAQDFSRFAEYILSAKDLSIIAPSNFPFPLSFVKEIYKEPRSYSRLVFVAHSEGAVVVRRSILDKLRKIENSDSSTPISAAARKAEPGFIHSAMKSDPLMNANLRLFAPACLGTNFSAALGFLTSFSTLLYAIGAYFKARNDLLPDSPIIKQIWTETERASKDYPACIVFRANILFGENDNVVHVGGYNCDFVFDYEKGHTHTSICKPTEEYPRPLEFAG